MSGPERLALAWAVRLLDGLLALTGMDLKPESRVHFETLRSLSKGKRS